jgi:hypothetical protein
MKSETPKLEIVDRVLTVKLPKKFDSYIEMIAKALKRTPESVLLEELYSILENFFEGGFASVWQEEVLCTQLLKTERGTGKKLQEQVSQVADSIQELGQ